MKKFAVLDIDGTLFRSQLYWEVALELARRQKLHKDINQKTLDLYESWKKRKSKDAFELFNNETIDSIDSLLTELDPTEYDNIIKEILTPLLDHTYVYTKKLMNDLKAKGYFIIAISGSRSEEVNIFAKHHGFDDWIGQTYERTEDRKKYTGNVHKTYKDKDLILTEFVKKHDLTYQDSYAIGDSGGDISILKKVSNPIAFNPNKELLAEAQKNGWKIVIERKSIAYIMEYTDGKYVLAEAN